MATQVSRSWTGVMDTKPLAACGRSRCASHSLDCGFNTAVNLGSDPSRGATLSASQIHPPVILTAASVVRLARIRHIPQVLALRAVSPVGKDAERGHALNLRVEAEPHVSMCQFSGFSG